MSKVLDQRVSINAHYSNHSQRNKGDRHDNDADRSRHWNPHQFRITHQNYKKNSLNSITGFYHTTEEFSRIGVVSRNGVHIAEFLLFHT